MSEPTNPGSHSSSRLSAGEGQEVGLGSPIKHRTHSFSLPFRSRPSAMRPFAKREPFPFSSLACLIFYSKIYTHIEYMHQNNLKLPDLI